MFVVEFEVRLFDGGELTINLCGNHVFLSFWRETDVCKCWSLTCQTGNSGFFRIRCNVFCVFSIIYRVLSCFIFFFLTAGSFQSHFILTLVCPFLEMTLVPETGKISSFLPHSRCKVCASSQLVMKARLAAGRGWWDTFTDFPSFLAYFPCYSFICWRSIGSV